MKNAPLKAMAVVVVLSSASCAALRSFLFPVAALPACAPSGDSATEAVPDGGTTIPDGGEADGSMGTADGRSDGGSLAGIADGTPEHPTTALKADAVKAAFVATSHLIAEAEQLLQQYPDADQVHRCLVRWESYEVSVAEREDRYLIHLAPRIDDCVPGGGALKGGGADYQVGKPGFQLICRDRTE